MLEHIKGRHGKYKKKTQTKLLEANHARARIKKKKSTLDGINSGFDAEKVKINGQKDMQ